MPSDDPGKLIIVDGSAAVGPTATWDLVVPLWAEIRALSRVMALLYTNTVRPRMRQIGETKRAYWRWGPSFDRDWDIPKVGISIAFVDNPQSGRIYMGLGFPETEHSQAVLTRNSAQEDYYDKLPPKLCPTIQGFPAKNDLAPYCAEEPTHLSIVNPTRAAALLVCGYLQTMLEMHTTYNAPLIRPFPNEERFKKLTSGDT